ncbi:MAG: glycosyltransferase [Nostocaceae cyanobacterium]|nr:glycosyltransferase [Nostocaceae cyanobacterium]
MKKPHLVITPSIPVWKDKDFLIFNRQFYDGVLLYVKMWGGDISCIMSPAKSDLPKFGLVKKKQTELPFRCHVLFENEPISIDHLEEASIVLAAGDSFQQLHVSKLCKKINARCVYIIEYIPETRYQIASLNSKNILMTLRRCLYIWNGERKRLAAFSLADGLQTNGTAAFYEYNQFQNKILYFDTRMHKNLLINDENLEKRLNYLSKNQPLRLAFSGRLISMKGGDHLVKMAMLLKQRNIDFHLTIYGAGELEDEMNKYINKHQLANNVFMAGAVDFYKKLIPELIRNVDLFVMLHRQSDPSCTYLETLSCGIPIVGYKNRAFSGLLEQADIGWGAKLDDLDGIVNIIEHLNLNREKISEKSKNSIQFARHHDFETTFKNRINHLYNLVK